MKLKLALLAAAGSLALGSVAHAGEGWYGALGAGYTFENDETDFESSDSVLNPAVGVGGFSTDYDLDEALNIYGAIGKYFDNGYRAEFEIATREQEVDELPGDGFGFAGFATDGDIGELSVTTFMANVYKDFDANIGGVVDPYVGAGVGFARLRSEINNLDQFTPASFPIAPNSPYSVVVGDQDFTTAFQAMAGLVFDIAENIDVDVRYRYLLTSEFDYGGFVNNQPANIDSEYSAHELAAGFRWNFGAAPAPAPVAPAPQVECWDGSYAASLSLCPAEIVEEVEAPANLSFEVYFNYDKSNLTTANETLIREKSQEALQYDIKSVSVEGNTDTVGSNSYNDALSRRRANVVRDALVVNGIPAGVIATSALGESNLKKPTADGVQEPLNRRTEVEFKF